MSTSSTEWSTSKASAKGLPTTLFVFNLAEVLYLLVTRYSMLT